MTENDFFDNEILNAIKNNEFVLYYQPQFNLISSMFEGVEALIRWQHPTKGLLLPNEFIPLAEQSDLIVAIDEWVLKSACTQMRIWKECNLPSMRMAVNVSSRQIYKHNYIEFVNKTLKETGLDPTCLELELSEKIVISDNDIYVIEMIKQLKNMGVLIALDDFGSSNSDVNQLKKIPVDRIKIDKKHIDNVHLGNSDALVVKLLILLAESMNIQIVAEGVETLMQLQALTSHECKAIQGYYFSEPLPAEQVEKFLIANQNGTFYDT